MHTMNQTNLANRINPSLSRNIPYMHISIDFNMLHALLSPDPQPPARPKASGGIKGCEMFFSKGTPVFRGAMRIARLYGGRLIQPESSEKYGSNRKLMVSPLLSVPNFSSEIAENRRVPVVVRGEAFSSELCESWI